jgi:transcriptional regulator with XRE-family HTH domain
MGTSAAQIRAARALLGWTQAQLAANSGLSEISIQKIEKGVTDPRASTLLAIERALDAGGVEFIDGGQPGVRMKRVAAPQFDDDGTPKGWTTDPLEADRSPLEIF